MSRAKGGFKTRHRRKKFLKLAKGFRNAGSRSISVARERLDRALAYAFRDRKVNKRTFRQLWTVRINAAARLNGTTYSKLISAIKTSGLELDRKVLADMAVNDPQAFTAICKEVTK